MKKTINYRKIAQQITFAVGNMGAFLSALLFAFHLYYTRLGLWANANERISYDNIVLCIALGSILILSISTMLFYEEKENKENKRK